MKNFTLNILALAAAIGFFVPTSMYPIDVTKDGVTIRISNEQDRSEILKSNDLLCFYVRIKNDTGTPIELPKYAVSSSLTASENHLTEVMGSVPQEIGKFMARFILGTGLQLAPCLATALYIDGQRQTRNDLREAMIILFIAGCITSPIIGATWAIKPCIHQTKIQAMLQEYLARQTTTIEADKEHGFYIYVHLDQYNRSIGKNITIKLYNKDTNQVIVCEVDTTGVLQTQVA